MADMIDLAQAKIVSSPDVRRWPMTAAITSLSFGEQGQTRVEFTKRHGPNRWPDVIPPEFDGPIQFTLWLFLKMNGTWTGAGFQEFWNDRSGTGDPGDPDVPSVYDKHWYYGNGWNPMQQHGPIAPGESIAFMVTSGDARLSKGPYGPSERSDVVVIPATDFGAFTFGDAPPIPQPPTPQPPGPSKPYPGDATWDAIGVTMLADWREAGRVIEAKDGSLHVVFDEQFGRWPGRTTWDAVSGDASGHVLTLDESIAKHRAEWRALLGLPPI